MTSLGDVLSTPELLLAAAVAWTIVVAHVAYVVGWNAGFSDGYIEGYRDSRDNPVRQQGGRSR